MTDLFELHKPIRNQIRKYKGEELLNIAMNLLLKNEMEIKGGSSYLPWECMLLVRWILQYSESGSNLKSPTISTVNNFINQIKKLYDHVPTDGFRDKHSIEKFMRRLAVQQFSYQMSYPEMGWRVGRQIILFNEIGAKENISQIFEDQTGLSIIDFLSISFGIFSILEPESTYSFKPPNLYSVFSAEKVQQYLNIVSLTPKQAKLYLNEDAKKKGKRFILQLYELSPLVRKPLLVLGENYVVYSKRLFRQFYTNFIYDFLYDVLPDRFGKFGDILEKYVRQCLESKGYEPILDKSWKKILGKEISAPDFTLCDNDATIFIEAKRKHLPNIPQIFQTNDTFSKHLDDSVVKGFVQIYTLANELLKDRPDNIKNFKNLYGVVVSYKNDYLRGGEQFWDEFLKDELLKKLNALNIDHKIIPPENMFLLPVDDIDYLMEFLEKYPDQTFGSVFASVKEYEADPVQSSFFFQDHLAKIAGEQIPRPEHLWKKLDIMMGDVIKKMKAYEARKVS